MKGRERERDRQKSEGKRERERDRQKSEGKRERERERDRKVKGRERERERKGAFMNKKTRAVGERGEEGREVERAFMNIKKLKAKKE